MKIAFAAPFVATVFAVGQAIAQVSGAPQTGPAFVTQQPSDQWLASGVIGQNVINAAGETIGQVDDLMLDQTGRIGSAVIGVGGFLGIGEKRVAVPFSSLTFAAGGQADQRVAKVAMTKEALLAAPDFKQTEKTMFMKARDKAGEYGSKAWEKANELTEQAKRKIEEMRQEQPKTTQ